MQYSIPDLKVWELGNEFQTAAALLCQESKEKNLLWVAAVNASFAIELYLKSFLAERKETGTGIEIDGGFEIMQYNSSSQRGHDLLDLYNKIDPVYRSHIEATFKNLFPGTDFIKEFEKYKDYFMGARYRYEKGAVGCVSGEVICFSEELKKVVFEVARRMHKNT